MSKNFNRPNFTLWQEGSLRCAFLDGGLLCCKSDVPSLGDRRKVFQDPPCGLK